MTAADDSEPAARKRGDWIIQPYSGFSFSS